MIDDDGDDDDDDSDDGFDDDDGNVDVVWWWWWRWICFSSKTQIVRRLGSLPIISYWEPSEFSVYSITTNDRSHKTLTFSAPDHNLYLVILNGNSLKVPTTVQS